MSEALEDKHFKERAELYYKQSKELVDLYANAGDPIENISLKISLVHTLPPLTVLQCEQLANETHLDLATIELLFLSSHGIPQFN